jgi:hypothetical protein
MIDSEALIRALLAYELGDSGARSYGCRTRGGRSPSPLSRAASCGGRASGGMHGARRARVSERWMAEPCIDAFEGQCTDISVGGHWRQLHTSGGKPYF